jgi:hypothetical protein
MFMFQDDGAGSVGMYATRNYVKGEVVLKISKQFLISESILESKVQERQTLAAALKEGGWRKHVDNLVLLYALLSDMRNQSSSFQPYYRVLPATLPHLPFFWSRDDLQHLEPAGGGAREGGGNKWTHTHCSNS